MYWEQDKDNEAQVIVGDVVDIVFHIECKSIRVDHGHALGAAIIAALPWFRDESRTAVHSIHVADSGNGWLRPDDPDELIFPSRRTRLTLRVPGNRIEDAAALSGTVLNISGHTLKVGAPTTKKLKPFSALYTRYLVAEDDNNEEEFLAAIVTELKAMSILPRKMMCGISKTIRTPDDKLRTRSLMLADLRPEESLLLMQLGLGEYQHQGCGIFIPHKNIKSIGESDSDSAN